MIQFDEITYKNFLSTGNTGQTLFLSRTPSALITGPNGSGKSTMLDALCFAVFNKPYRAISKTQLVNSVNEKGLEVTLKLRVKGIPYKIIRGVKPNIFEIYKEDNLLTQDASLRDYQQKLEDIIGLNYKSFTQIVILGTARYQSFMDLANWERRGIIEEILDITVFSRMNAILKTRDNNLELDIKDTDYNKDLNKTKISAQNGLIDNITARSRESVDKIEEEELRVNAEIKLLEEQLIKKDSDIESLLLEITEEDKLKNKLKEGEYQLFKVKTELTSHDKKLSFYQNNSICPECDQPLTEEHKNNKISLHAVKKTKYSSIIGTAETAISNIQDNVRAINAVKEKVTDIRSDKSKLAADINSNKAYLNNLNNNKNVKADAKSLNDAKAQLAALKEEKKEIQSKSLQQLELKHHLEVCKVLLKDTGIKAKIIKQYLPVMNKLINKYLDRMGANYSFNLDENFNESIKSRYRDHFSYASFSEGEKMRIDLALMFTWREIAKLKNSVNTNLLIMDEVGDSSLDAEATDILWDIIGDMEGTNVWVISHKYQTGDRFKSLIEFYKQGNFSYIKDSIV